MQEETQVQQWARWWNTLDDWCWPDDLPGKPEDYDALSNAGGSYDESGKWHYERCKLTVTRGLRATYETLASPEECLRWHWAHNLTRSDEEFERWWKSGLDITVQNA